MGGISRRSDIRFNMSRSIKKCVDGLVSVLYNRNEFILLVAEAPFQFR